MRPTSPSQPGHAVGSPNPPRSIRHDIRCDIRHDIWRDIRYIIGSTFGHAIGTRLEVPDGLFECPIVSNCYLSR